MNPQTDGAWGLQAARLPERLDHWRVLEVGPPVAERFLRPRGIEQPTTLPWPTEEHTDEVPFQLAHLGAGLDGELHPLSVGAWLWWRLMIGGLLVLEGTVLADASKTAFAEFVVDPPDSDQRWRWLPGRMTLRWMVENSGFDDVVWLGERPGKEPGTLDVCLQASRVDRGPAVDLTRQPLAS